MRNLQFVLFYSNWGRTQVLPDQYKTILMHWKVFSKAKVKVVNYVFKKDV